MARAQAAEGAAIHEEPACDRNAPDGRPIDLVHLSRYTLGDRDIEREVLEMFRGQSRRFLSRLAEADDIASWQVAAHTLKGSAKGIGAWSVAWAAEAAEALPGGPGGEGAASALGRLETAIEESCGFIDTLLASD